jgi:hypothetical protein
MEFGVLTEARTFREHPRADLLQRAGTKPAKSLTGRDLCKKVAEK